VTGGAGFIGFHLARELATKGYNVIICDNLSRGQFDKDLRDLLENEHVVFTKMDLAKPDSTKDIDHDVDIVFHLAAINGTRYFYEIPFDVLTVNLLSLINILRWLNESRCRRFIWLSSPEVYSGTIQHLDGPVPTPEDVPVCITNTTNPRFSYACSKIAGESLCLNFANGRMSEVAVTVVRPHNIYGPRMGFEHVIPELLLRILRREDPLAIFGSDNKRAFCYVTDLVRALILVAQSDQLNGQIINIGNDTEETTILSLANALCKLFNFNPRFEIHEAPPGSARRRCPNLSKARSVLRYTPQVNLDAGLRMTSEWYSQWFQETSK
jgi:UDP-glucose 4-epimerase